MVPRGPRWGREGRKDPVEIALSIVYHWVYYSIAADACQELGAEDVEMRRRYASLRRNETGTSPRRSGRSIRSARPAFGIRSICGRGLRLRSPASASSMTTGL